MLTTSYVTHPVVCIRVCPGDPQAFHSYIINYYTN